MILGLIKRIAKENLSKRGEVPPWIDELLQPLNTFIETVTVALRNGLTFKDNFLCNVKQIKLVHGVESQVNPENSKLKVSGVLCLYAGGLVVDKFGWRQLSSGNIGVTISYDGGTSTTNAICELIIFFQ
ncbi:MAG: hypothetical protein H0X02_01620 [Nitrosomonas sp.]|nr:hypothetical protein [Nitrosomonas sp.]